MMTYVRKEPNIGVVVNMVFETKEQMNNWFKYMSRLYDPEINTLTAGRNLERQQWEGTVMYYKKGEPHFIEVK